MHQRLKLKGKRLRKLENEDGVAIFDIRGPGKETVFSFGETTNYG